MTKVNSDATLTAGPWTGWDEDTSLQIHHPSATMRKNIRHPDRDALLTPDWAPPVVKVIKIRTV